MRSHMTIKGRGSSDQSKKETPPKASSTACGGYDTTQGRSTWRVGTLVRDIRRKESCSPTQGLRFLSWMERLTRQHELLSLPREERELVESPKSGSITSIRSWLDSRSRTLGKEETPEPS